MEEEMSAKKFYNSFETSGSKICQLTGVSRQSLNRLVQGTAQKGTAEVVLAYLVKQNAEIYLIETKKCRSEMEKCVTQIRNAWRDYIERENLLNDFYEKYKIEKHNLLAKRVLVKEVLRDVLKKE